MDPSRREHLLSCNVILPTTFIIFGFEIKKSLNINLSLAHKDDHICQRESLFHSLSGILVLIEQLGTLVNPDSLYIVVDS